MTTAQARENYYSISREVQAHGVQAGESLSSIADAFGLQEQTEAWAALQEDSLKAKHGSLLNFTPLEEVEPEPTRQLLLPPTDGAFYVWKMLDTLELVANDFAVEPSMILDWPSDRPYLVQGMFRPDIGDVVFVPMPSNQCSYKLKIPLYFRCR
ncbi:MAG: hypothetical protein WBR18_07190 [Anaerolineales bacterium]